jgi:hypothetical protein
VIITLEHSTVHQESRTLEYKSHIETAVDYYDFAFYFKPKDTNYFHLKILEISSVSVLKLSTDSFIASKVSLVHFESCEKSPLKVQNINITNIGNCIANTLEIVSENNLNLSRFGIELKAHDFKGRLTFGNCLSQRISKNETTLQFSNNFENVSVQDILLKELVRGLPASFNCAQKGKGDLIILSLRFSPHGSKQSNMYYDFQVSSSLHNHEEFIFLTCDGVRHKIDFGGYLEPFDAQTWFGIIISLLIISGLMAILVSHSPNTSFIDSCLRSFFMNFSFLTGVANAPLNLIVNFQLNAIRMLIFSWGIATIVLCSLYSSLVTTNVVAPKALVSPWTEYKQLEKFAKVFGLNNPRLMLRIDGYSKAVKSDPEKLYYFGGGSKVSRLWRDEVKNKLFAKYKPDDHCYPVSGNSSSCQASRKKLFEFIDSYTYALRSDVLKLKEKLSVCTNTAFIDTETSINCFLHIWNQDEHLPSMVKGTSFFLESYSWTMSHTWLLRKLLNSRLNAFTTSGIIGFWERFCLKHCKKSQELSELQNPPTNSKAATFNAQKLESNISSLFFILLITFAISILCLLGERFFRLTSECLTLFLSYRTVNNVIR